ncbi:MAG: chloride channel protein [Bacteroidales bacterium]|nr:chloride channel protein [Bacteroidales bacterium]
MTSLLPKLPRRKVKTEKARITLSEKTKLLLLAVLVGLLCGCAAILLKTLIHWIQTGLTSWFRVPLDGMLLLLYPGVGMLLSLLFVRYLLKDDISHGVTKVLQAVSQNDSNIKAHNTWSSIAASSVTIGFGGSVGAEAPIVYSGAAIGSVVARKAGLSYKNMTMLLGCGAAAAIAGIFKAPLAGVLFTLEILLFNMSMNAILPLLLSSVTATVVTYLFMGTEVQFAGSIEAFRMANIPFYLVLGVFCGFMSLYFIRVTLKVEDRMRRFRSPYTRWALCALLLGVLIFLFPPLYGEGYSSLSLMLNNDTGSVPSIFGSSLESSPWLFLLYFAAIMLFKVFATAFTNAGGGVGGTFGPTLVSGGLAGFVIARLINLSGLAVVPEANFVLVGMGGLMAGVMQAPMTAIFLIAEITGGYELLIPLIVTAAVSYGTIRGFERYSIYTKRIAAQGELLTHDNDQAVLTLLRTADLVERDFTPVRYDATLGDLVHLISTSRRNLFPVLDAQDRFQGVVTLDDVRSMMFDRSHYDTVKVYNVMKSAPAFVYMDEKMDSVMNKFESTQAWNLPVLDDENKYLGFVSKSKIFSSYRDQLKAVSDE